MRAMLSRIARGLPAVEPRQGISLRKPKMAYMARPEYEDPNNEGRFIDNLVTNAGGMRGFPADRAWRYLAKKAFGGEVVGDQPLY